MFCSLWKFIFKKLRLFLFQSIIHCNHHYHSNTSNIQIFFWVVLKTHFVQHFKTVWLQSAFFSFTDLKNNPPSKFEFFSNLKIRDEEAFWYEIEVSFFLRLEADFFVLSCYHARHLQQIHWNENFCRMFGLAVIASDAWLNICQILMRLVEASCFKNSLLKSFFWCWNKHLGRTNQMPLEFFRNFWCSLLLLQKFWPGQF